MGGTYTLAGRKRLSNDLARPFVVLMFFEKLQVLNQENPLAKLAGCVQDAFSLGEGKATTTPGAQRGRHIVSQAQSG